MKKSQKDFSTLASMRRRFTIASAALLVLTSGCSSLNQKVEVVVVPSIDCIKSAYEPSELYSRAKDSVVFVSTEESIGSGFIVRHQDGKTLIVTNSHVTNTSDTVKLKLHDKTETTGNLVSDGGGYNWEAVEDAPKDIALIQVDGIIGKPIKITSEVPSIGEEVVVIGAPQGLEFSISRGIVSGLRLDNQILQTDAPVNPGNSGGPIINKSGCLIGMSTFIRNDSDGLSFGLTGSVITNFLKNPPAITLNPEVPLATPIVSARAPSKSDRIQPNRTRQPNCWAPKEGQTKLVSSVCDIIKRTNANGHTVFDIHWPHMKITVVLWDDNTAEVFFQEQRFMAEWHVDDANDVVVDVEGQDYRFAFTA